MKNLLDVSAILKLKEKGLSNRAIARTLGIDKKTVNKYWNVNDNIRMYKKWNLIMYKNIHY